MQDGWTLAISRSYDDQPVASLPGTNGSVGRPRGSFAEIDWIFGEVLYTEGELITPVDDEAPKRLWPTLEEVGKRLGCTMQAVAYHAKRQKWQDKRRKFQFEYEFGSLASQMEGNPNPASRLTRKPLEILEDYLALFEDQISKKKLRADAITDFDKAVRLRAFLLNEGAAEQTKRQLMSLEEMRDRHEAHRTRRATYDETAAGVIKEDGPTDGVNAPRARPEEHAPMGEQTQGESPSPAKEKLTAEELSAQRSARARKMMEGLTPEERTRRARKAAETRIAKQAIAALRRRKSAGFKG